MRVDERIEAALLDPGDVRPLLLGATRRELETLRRIIGRRGEYETLGVFNVEGFAAAIEARVAGELRRDAANAPFLHLSVWAAEKLGASAKPVALSTADAEVLRLSKGDALVRRVFHDLADKQAVVLRLAIAIARLRQKKLRRIRWWQPLLNLLIAKEKPVDNTILPPETLAFAGDDMNDIKQDDAWWEAIKNAGCRLPVSMWEDKLRDIRDDIGRFNIVVAGRTGVGKTTLIGAIFGQEVGDTLMGRPRTRGRIWYPEHPGEGDILRLCDTEGLEMERYSETLDGLKNEIKTRNASRDP
ncbi:MAG: GTPase domain-containing protein, partial [Alphaproteobacteria bacterium]